MRVGVASGFANGNLPRCACARLVAHGDSAIARCDAVAADGNDVIDRASGIALGLGVVADGDGIAPGRVGERALRHRRAVGFAGHVARCNRPCGRAAPCGDGIMAEGDVARVGRRCPITGRRAAVPCRDGFNTHRNGVIPRRPAFFIDLGAVAGGDARALRSRAVIDVGVVVDLRDVHRVGIGGTCGDVVQGGGRGGAVVMGQR